MKQEFRKIFHVKTDKGWEQLPYPPKVSIHTADAEVKNKHWQEHGVKFIPANDYEKFLANSRLLN